VENVIGVIVNRTSQENTEYIVQKMEKVLGTNVIGSIPEDHSVRKAAAAKTPIVLKYPLSDFSKAIKKISAKIAGVQVAEPAEVSSEKFIDRFAKALFRGKK